jgi:hypothetical protein
MYVHVMSRDESGSTRFEMRVPKAWLSQVDEWRRLQADLPSRAEAIRRLVELGLANAERETARD